MRFKSLTVKGAVPFPEEVQIDFPDKRKIAMVGDNGCGKSTLLDCIHAALFGNVTKNGSSIYSLFPTKEGLIDFSFEMKGHNYQVRRLINGVSRSQKPYLYEDGHPITEGKVAEFAAAIGQVVGISEDAFLATVYNAQTQKGNPLSLNDGDRRSLLSETLGLWQFDEPYTVSSNALKAEYQNVERLKIEIGLIADVDIQSLEAAIAEEKIQLATAEEEIIITEQAIEKARQDVANAQANSQQLDEVNRQIATLNQQLVADRATKADLEAKILHNRSEILEKREAILEAVRTTGIKTAEAENLEYERTRLSGEADQMDIRVRESIGKMAADLQALQGQLAEIQVSNRQIEAARQQHLSEIVKYDSLNTGLRTQTETLDKVPCKGTEMHTTCLLLKAANEAVGTIASNEQMKLHIQEKIAALLPETEKETALAESVAELQTRLQAEQRQNPSLPIRTRVAELDRQLSESRGVIAQLAPLAQKADALETAEAKIADYTASVQQADIRINANTLALSQWEEKLKNASDIIKTIQTLNAEVARLTGVKTNQIRYKENHVGRIAQLDQSIAESRQKQIRKGELSELLEKSLHRVSLLELLAEGFGPKGARALKIDAAGPEISELVNALLRECYGGEFTIQIKTLKSLITREGEFRETLDFSIINNETGEENPVEEKSGGQQQLIREVISLGLCIYQRRRAGVVTETIIRDESCSALTTENRKRYVNMLDLACQIGGFNQVIYVSHDVNAQQMADAIIEIENGQVKVVNG